MDTRMKILVVAITTIVAMAVIGFGLINSIMGTYALLSMSEGGQYEFDELAKCLSRKGISMAGADWCSACKKQRGLFGSSFSLVDYKNCELETEWCSEQGIEYFPTWTFPDGSKAVGVQSIEKLAKLSGCKA